MQKESVYSETELLAIEDPKERTEYLRRSLYDLIPVDIAAATRRAEKACELAVSLADQGLEGIALDLLGECYARSGRYSEAIEVMERAIPLLEASGAFLRAMVVNTNIGNTHWFAGENEKGLARFIESRERARAVDDREHLLIVANNIGSVLINLGRVAEAEEELNASLALGRQLDDRHTIAATLHNLGRVRIEQRDYRNGLATLEEGLQLFNELDYGPGISAISITLGRSYEMLGNRVAALEAYNRSITVSRAIGDRRSEAGVLNNVGSLYHADERLDDAAEHFRLSLSIKEELGNRHDLANTLLNLAQLSLERDDLKSASEFFERVHEIGEEEEVPLFLTHGLLGRVRVAQRREESSDRIAHLVNAARDSLTAIEDPAKRRNPSADLGAIEIEIGEPERAIETLVPTLVNLEENEREDFQRRVYGLLANACRAAGDISSAFEHVVAQQEIERRLSRRNADNRLESQMAIYEVDRARTEGALARKEAEILRLEKRGLEEEARHRQRELLSTAMFLSQKNDFLRTLHRRLANADVVEELQSIADEIAAIVDTESSWDRFEGEFRKVHGNYLQVIASRHPKLTPTELKVCALVRTGLSTKEIARILIAEPRSIDKYRQRIRKKIGLESSKNLQVYLQGVEVRESDNDQNLL